MYNKTVINHFVNPRTTGEIVQADGIGTVGNPNCGDMVKLYIKVVDGSIVDVKYKTFGCAAAIASSSAASELIKGKTLDEALAISAEEIVSELNGLPVAKIECSVIAHDAIRTAIEDYRKKRADASST